MIVIKNFLYNVGYQILALVLPLITIPYVSRVLGVEGIGKYAFSYATTQYFCLVGMLGISIYGSRKIAEVKSSNLEVSKTFFEIYKLQILASLSSFVVYFLIFVHNNDFIYFAQSLFVLSVVFDISWLYTGTEDFKKIVIRNTLVKIVGLILIFLLVKDKNDLNIYSFILSGSMLIGQLSMWIGLRNKVTYVASNIKGEFLKHLKPAFMIFVPAIAISIYSILDRTMLGIINGETDVAFYDQGQKIIRVALSIIPALSVVMMPRISSLRINKEYKLANKYLEKSFLFTSIISIAMAFGLVGISKEFVPLFYGPQYLPVVDVFYLSSWIIIAIGIANVFGIQYLIAMNQENKYTVSVTVAAICNFVLNLILLPKLGYKGACVSTLIAEIIGVVIQVYYVRKELDVRKMFEPYFKLLLSGIFMLFVVRIVGNLNGIGILTLIIQIISGISVYMTLIFILGVVDYKKIIRLIRTREPY